MSFPAITMCQIGPEPVQSVNGRDLHAFLGVARDFPTWMRDRIDTYSFSEGADYEVFPETGENPAGGRPAKNYALSIDMAKELAMVERTPKGQQVRLYFIECEKRAKAAAITALPDFTNPAVAARAWADQCEGRAIAEQRLLDVEPKAAAYDRFANSDGLIVISNAAKDLQIEIKALFAWLLANRWIFRRLGSKRYIGFADKIRDGYLKHKFDDVPMPDGSVVQKERVFLTRKGIARLAVILGREVKP
jgi:anti-repressor protein